MVPQDHPNALKYKNTLMDFILNLLTGSNSLLLAQVSTVDTQTKTLGVL